jgi:aryl-alcohol dehydrogenase-like predicted oxidoreductase
MGNAMVGRRDKVFLMTKFCCYHSKKYSRDKNGAMLMLEDSLKRLKTDHVDLWMLHNVKGDDAKDAYAANGAIEALELVKKQGKIRYTGFTGHTTPQVHIDLIKGGYEWDATLMPVSVVGALDSRAFEKQLMPLCEKHKIAVLGMKGFGGSRRTHLHGKTNVNEALRYSLSYPQVCTHLVGVDKLDYVNQAVAVAPNKPMNSKEREQYAFVDHNDPVEKVALQHGGQHYEKGLEEGQLA